MGRKKKRNKPLLFCYYCERIFDNERVLIQHQRAKHFKCPQCRKTMSTAHGMMVHVFQVHKDTIDSVPAAKEGRGSFDMEIYGMDGVPADIIEQKRIKIYGEAAAKKPRLDVPKMPSPLYGSMGVPNPAQFMMQMSPQMSLYPGVGHPSIAQGMMPIPMPLPMHLPGTMMPPIPPPHMVPSQAPRPMPPLSDSTQAIMPDSNQPSTQPRLPPSMPIPSSRLIQLPSRTGVQGGNSPYVSPAGPLALSPPASQLSQATAGMKNLDIVLIFDNENSSQEEIRAMHPKYTGHVRSKITSLSASIEARLRSLQ